MWALVPAAKCHLQLSQAMVSPVASPWPASLGGSPKAAVFIVEAMEGMMLPQGFMLSIHPQLTVAPSKEL